MTNSFLQATQPLPTDLQSPNWAEVGQFVVAVIGLVSLAFVWYQIRQTSKWNRLTSQHNWLNNSFSLTLVKELYRSTTAVGVTVRGRISPLTDREVTTILEDDDAYAAVITFLNEFENVCGAVRACVADDELAYGIHSARVIREFEVYKPFIDRIRARDQDSLIWIEFEKIYYHWRVRYLKEQEEEKKDRDKKGIMARG